MSIKVAVVVARTYGDLYRCVWCLPAKMICQFGDELGSQCVLISGSTPSDITGCDNQRMVDLRQHRERRLSYLFSALENFVGSRANVNVAKVNDQQFVSGHRGSGVAE